MKEFNKDLEYREVMFLMQKKDADYTIDVVSNLALETYLSQYLYYYKETTAVRFQQPEQFLEEQQIKRHVFLLLDISYLAPYLYYHFYELNEEDVTEEVSKIKKYLDLFFDKILNTDRDFIIAEFEMQDDNLPLGMNSLNTVLKQLNEYLQEKCSQSDRAYVLPLSSYVYQYGTSRFYDRKKKYVISSPYSTFAYNCIAYNLLKIIDSIGVGNKKCLVLDCDNVLWKGILGEEGIQGIQLSNQFVGRAYLDFQLEIMKLYAQGVIICLCSKNEMNDVMNVIENHPDMLLRDQFISAYRINYRNKADNIRELAKELNIGLSDMVFVDDSVYEIELIKHELKEVETICLDANKPYLYADILRNSMYFMKKKITETDRIRNQDYKQRARRQQLLLETTNLEDYHKLLQSKVVIEKMNEYTLTRVAEISKRTNQFNLSAKSYSEQYLSKILQDKNRDIFVLRAYDIFGDMGIVAVAELLYSETSITIEAMFLSCRVFGRNFELDLLNEIRRIAESKNITKIYGIYQKTERNQRFENFYKENQIEEKGTVTTRGSKLITKER